MLGTLALAAALLICAALLARHQLRSYRLAKAVGKDESDFFRYSRRRLIIRLLGTAILAATGITLAVWELAAPRSADGAQRLVVILTAEVATLVVVALLDLRETAKRR